MRAERWIPFLILLFSIGAAFDTPFLMILTSMMGIVILIARSLKKRSLDGVRYRRRPFYWRGFPGEEVNLEIEVENDKLLPLTWLRVSDPWPVKVGPIDPVELVPSHIPNVGVLAQNFSLRWYARVRRSFRIRFRSRGVYRVGPVRLESGDLFGFYDHSAERGPKEQLTVFPNVTSLQELHWPTDDPYGEKSVQWSLYTDPNLPMGVRDYQPEDEFRRVHWPATARTGQLKSKMYQPVSAKVGVVCLNVSTFPHYWEGTNPELLEHVIEIAASLVNRGIEDGYQIGLISNGGLANSDQPFRILPARSTRQLARMLAALAGVTPLTTASFARFLIREVPRLPYRATLMVITAVISPDLLELLVRLKHRGRRITLISCGGDPAPQIKGLQSVHLPLHR